MASALIPGTSNGIGLLLFCSVLIFAFSTAVAAPSYAQHMNEPDSPCSGAAGTSDQVACLLKAKGAPDPKLNSAYETLRYKLDPSDATRLLETKQTWVKYREANCSAARTLYGEGTAAAPVYLACLEAITGARAKELLITYMVTEAVSRAQSN